MSLIKLEWNHVKLEDHDCRQLRERLISLMAFSTDRSPTLIGTAFIIGAFGNCAIAVTAAHNFEAILDTQKPYKRHHLSALSEFLPKAESINLDTNRVGAMCVSERSGEMCAIGWAGWDRKADIAFFLVSSQGTENNTFFNSRFELEVVTPKIGDEIIIIGYANMAITEKEYNEAGCKTFSIEQQLIVRCGIVTNVHANGHLLCKDTCIETSIPVFPGMSGGLVARLGGTGVQPFGVISSDPDDEVSRKFDCSIRGASIVALLGTSCKIDADGQMMGMFNLKEAMIAHNKEQLMKLEGSALEGEIILRL